jgi:hypothetical protein
MDSKTWLRFMLLDDEPLPFFLPPRRDAGRVIIARSFLLSESIVPTVLSSEAMPFLRLGFSSIWHSPVMAAVAVVVVLCIADGDVLHFLWS